MGVNRESDQFKFYLLKFRSSEMLVGRGDVFCMLNGLGDLFGMLIRRGDVPA